MNSTAMNFLMEFRCSSSDGADAASLHFPVSSSQFPVSRFVLLTGSLGDLKYGTTPLYYCFISVENFCVRCLGDVAFWIVKHGVGYVGFNFWVYALGVCFGVKQRNGCTFMEM